MTPSEALKARLILEQARLAGWIESNNYWDYPVISPDGDVIATRQKKYPFAPEPKKMKYLWKGGKPENLDTQWYILKDTKHVIESARGVAYLSNGEPAMLAYRAGGVLNALSTTLSEIAVPKDAINYLRRMGISRLIYVVDKDGAGLQSAQNWHDSLSGSGIDLELRQWPKHLVDKADANDALIAVGGIPQEFATLLENTIPLSLTATTPQKTAAPKIDFTEAHSKLASAILEALSAKGALTGKRFQSGFYQTVCIHHDEQDASAGYDPKTGVINCFRCGSHGIKENAQALNIDWREYFPTQEKKTPKKAEIKAFEQSLDESITIQDTRDYAQVLSEEIEGREMAYDYALARTLGVYLLNPEIKTGVLIKFKSKHLSSFFKKDFPLGVLSGVLNLSIGRSSLALYLTRLHRAMKTGRIKSYFTEAEAVVVTGLSRTTVFRANLEAENLGFVAILRGISSNIDSLGKESLQKGGRPATVYLAELESTDIIARLHKMLEIFYLEKHSKKAIAMPTMQLARQFGASAESLRDWQSRAKAALEDKDNKSAKQAFDTEMFGNGGNWKGWEAALNSRVSAPLDYSLYEDSLALRAALLKWWVAHVRDCNSRDELSRLLGCTDPVIDKVLDFANLKNVRQQEKVEFAAPKTVKQFEYEWGKNQRDLRGKCWKGGILLRGGNGAWTPIDDKDYLETYAKHAGEILKVYMLIVTPSVQRPMTEAEITKRNEEREKEEVQVVTQVTVSKDNAPAERRSYRYQQWDKHSYAFMYRQLQLLIHCFTPHALEGHVIVDKKGNGVASGKLAELFAWLLENGAKTPTRKVKSFYGKGYNEERDLVALQALADERIKALGIKETWDFDDSADNLPIFAELPRQAPMNFELNKPAPMLTPHGYIYGSPDNPEYFDYLNNPYVSAWEQANREAKVKQWKEELKGIAS